MRTVVGNSGREGKESELGLRSESERGGAGCTAVVVAVGAVVVIVVILVVNGCMVDVEHNCGVSVEYGMEMWGSWAAATGPSGKGGHSSHHKECSAREHR